MTTEEKLALIQQRAMQMSPLMGMLQKAGQTVGQAVPDMVEGQLPAILKAVMSGEGVPTGYNPRDPNSWTPEQKGKWNQEVEDRSQKDFEQDDAGSTRRTFLNMFPREQGAPAIGPVQDSPINYQFNPEAEVYWEQQPEGRSLTSMLGIPTANAATPQPILRPMSRRDDSFHNHFMPNIPIGQTYYQMSWDWPNNPGGPNWRDWHYRRRATLTDPQQQNDFNFTPQGLVPKVPGYVLSPIGWIKQ